MDSFIPVCALPLADVIYSFRTSGLSGQLIVIVLFVGSIFSWSVMIHKILELRKAQEETDRFLAGFRQEAHPVSLYLKQRRFPKSPLFAIYENVCAAIGAELETESRGPRELPLSQAGWVDYRLGALQFEAVRNVTDRTVADQALLLESYMSFLATAVSASPLLGLLGTVWGVMDAFSAMALQGMATLSAVAPGISAALLTTVVGLLVALPSSIGYNVIAGRIRQIHVQMDNFAEELNAEIKRNFLRDH